MSIYKKLQQSAFSLFSKLYFLLHLATVFFNAVIIIVSGCCGREKRQGKDGGRIIMSPGAWRKMWKEIQENYIPSLPCPALPCFPFPFLSLPSPSLEIICPSLLLLNAFLPQHFRPFFFSCSKSFI